MAELYLSHVSIYLCLPHKTNWEMSMHCFLKILFNTGDEINWCYGKPRKKLNVNFSSARWAFSLPSSVRRASALTRPPWRQPSFLILWRDLMTHYVHCTCRSGLCKLSIRHLKYNPLSQKGIWLYFDFWRGNIPQSFLKDYLPGYNPQVDWNKFFRFFLRY